MPYAILREPQYDERLLQSYYGRSQQNGMPTRNQHRTMCCIPSRSDCGYLLSIASEASDSLFYQEMRTSNLHDVADWLGTSYRHLNRIITNYVKKRFSFDDAKIIIVDLERIREKANGNSYE
ncbi:helix-turn-helix domain-containing protein [Exiguobacterium acetylicum]|uniref:helix-turn-helix domain-containing protein n=1 Tax=Exiguobacterium acetylicum TaxID=41170 RepID=UPI001269840D|nr:helix-turn-helix domain-containing protein [Exiguobacterium acetylicum]